MMGARRTTHNGVKRRSVPASSIRPRRLDGDKKKCLTENISFSVQNT
jgi:hypothetical protein